MARLLLEHDADIDAVESGHERTPLDMTLRGTELGDLGQFLVSQGATITCFHTLCKLGLLEQVDAAIGVDPQIVNRVGEYPSLTAGYTPLHYALFGKRREVLKRLVEAGADLETRSVLLDKTPIEWAQRSDEDE